uniref:Endonuclease domain conjugation cluster detT, truncated n=1 Tax=Staphylococcus aureus TaxID=1280 RepID=A0A1W5T8W0_STAAU|nr:endonuclease domain conjugation cluster detT, truncated [Staphylococcus aureus]
MKVFKSLIALLLSCVILSGCDTETTINKVDDLISNISESSKPDTPKIKIVKKI